MVRKRLCKPTTAFKIKFCRNCRSEELFLGFVLRLNTTQSLAFAKCLKNMLGIWHHMHGHSSNSKNMNNETHDKEHVRDVAALGASLVFVVIDVVFCMNACLKYKHSTQ